MCMCLSHYHGDVDDYKWENSLGGIIIVVNCRELWFAAHLCACCLVYFTSEHKRLCLFAAQPSQYKQVSRPPANHTVGLLVGKKLLVSVPVCLLSCGF